MSLRTMLDIKSTVTEAAHHVTERLSRAATGALDAFTSSVSRAGLSVVDGVLAKASALVGASEDTATTPSAPPPALQAAPHGKAAAKKRKQAKVAMQKLVKAAKRGAGSARRHVS